MPSIPDVAFIDLEYASGTIAHVELSWLAPSKLRRTTIVGSEKMVVYDDTSTEPVRIFDSGVVLKDPETFGEYRLTLPDRRHRLAADRRGRAALARAARLLRVDQHRLDAALLRRARTRGRTDDRGRRPVAVTSAAPGSPVSEPRPARAGKGWLERRPSRERLGLSSRDRPPPRSRATSRKLGATALRDVRRPKASVADRRSHSPGHRSVAVPAPPWPPPVTCSPAPGDRRDLVGSSPTAV